MTDLDQVLQKTGSRGYRVVHLRAGLAAGRMALAAFGNGAGATNLTFADDPVAEFFETTDSCLLVTAVGIPAYRNVAGGAQVNQPSWRISKRWAEEAPRAGHDFTRRAPRRAAAMNRLGGQGSPYLLQHKDNPVEWYPWGDEALETARALGRPLFVSIGYSSCHWCHVMARESFEDEETARYINTHLVPVKVDREERPDIDAIYMEAVQQLNGGRGGWPLSVFTTPDGKPFFGGTYFPPTARNDVPSFRSVLEAVSDAWATRRRELMDRADALTAGVASRLEDGPH